MFDGELAETTDTIELPDCEYVESLLEVFRYIYSDEVNLKGSNAMGVLCPTAIWFLHELRNARNICKII